MKKILFVLLLFLSFASKGHSNEAITTLKVGYYRPTSGVLRDIYSSAWLSVQLEGCVSVAKQDWLWKRFYVNGNVSYMEKSGRSLGIKRYTKMKIVPFNAGLRYMHPFRNIWLPFDVYAGAGPSYFLVFVENDAVVAKRHVSKGGFGGYVETGIFLRTPKHWMINFFIEYLFANINPPSSRACRKHDVEVGGLCIGAGLGYRY